MSAVYLLLEGGQGFYTKDYDTPTEVENAIDRGDELTVFWYTSWGRRFQETLLVKPEQVAYIITEREVP